MPKIHTTQSTYSAPSPVAGWSWLPYADPSSQLTTLKSAISIIDTKIKSHLPCNNAFKALPLGKTFLQIWNDPTVWISLDPGNMKGRYGATLSKKHITLSAYTLNMGKWTTAATLVHELAHVGGALGTDSKAEDTLLKCLLKSLHDPTIIGELINRKKRNRSYLV